MKKILIVFGILIILFFAAIIIVPLLFKSQIVELVKTEANKNINATLDFEDVGLSLIKHFPELTVSIDKLHIINKEPFAGDTLISLEEFQASLNLQSLIMGDQIEVVSIQMVKPQIKARILKDGRANWDIVPEAEIDTTEIETESAYNLAVREYKISDAQIMFIDDSTNMFIEINGLYHEGKGDFGQALFTLFTQTSIDALTLKMNDVSYLNKAELTVKADLEMDMENMKFSFVENEIRLNQLGLNFDGWIALVSDENIEMDLTFKALKTDFKHILSMVPYIYQRDFADLKAEGQLALTGTVKGLYTEEQIPSFDINLNVSDGMFQYPEMPASVEKVQVDLKVSNPGKTPDHTIVNLDKLHLEILNEPLDIKLLVKTPVSDPFIDASFMGSLNLSEVQNLLPVEEKIELKGMIQSDIKFKGNMSAVEKKQADRLTFDGTVTLSDIEYAAPDLPVTVQIPEGKLNLTPQKMSLENFNMLLGDSDIKVDGFLENFLEFALEDQTLTGKLAIQSNYFIVDPWMTEEEEEGEKDKDTTVLEPIELPDKVEFLITADLKKIVFDNLTLADAKGKFLLKDRTLKIIDLGANLLQGSMVTNGAYSYIPPAKPHVTFDMKITRFNIPEMYKTFNTVQKLAPMAENLRGDISGDLDLHTDMSDSLTPVWSSLNSKGSLNIPRASIEDFKPLNKVADKLKIEALRNPTITNFNPSYEIKDGRFYLDPTDLNIDKYKVTVSGSNGMDKSLDYLLRVKMPASDVSRLVNQDVSLLTGEDVPVDVLVKGTISDPDVSVSLDEFARGVTDRLKDTAKKEADKRKVELEKKAKEELEKKKKAEEDKLKKELEKKKKEEEKKLKDKLKGLFGK